MYSPLNSYAYIHWILDFKYILLLLLMLVEVCAVFCYYLQTIDVCTMYMAHVCFMSVVVTVWGSVGSLLCSGRC